MVYSSGLPVPPNYPMYEKKELVWVNADCDDTRSRAYRTGSHRVDSPFSPARRSENIVFS